MVAGFTTVAGRRVFAWDYFSSTGFPQFVGPTTDSTGAPINGARHTSFGGGVDASPTSIAIQADGKVVLVGDATFTSGIPGAVDRFMAIARYNVDGTMDATFNGAGLRGVDFGDGIFSFASASPFKRTERSWSLVMSQKTSITSLPSLDSIPTVPWIRLSAATAC